MLNNNTFLEDNKTDSFNRKENKMTKYSIPEKRVLKKLGIKDFRYMTKDKIVKFVSMLPYMDVEVAKKALEQFPEFEELASGIVNCFKEIVDEAWEAHKISQTAFCEACKTIIESLQKDLEDENMAYEKREQTINKMIEVASMIGEKNSEDKRMVLKLVGGLGTVIFIIVGAAASIIGVNSQARFENDQDRLNNPDYQYNYM